MTSLIRSFQAGDEVAFRALNEQWIRQYFELEAKDEEVFADPQRAIVGRGGQILFAILADETVGCCALLPMDDGGFEVGKMAVAHGYQGEGIGRQLLRATIEEAQRMGAHRLYLETNHILLPAITLYESVGFRRIDPDRASPYTRSDVYMELQIDSHPGRVEAAPSIGQ